MKYLHFRLITAFVALMLISGVALITVHAEDGNAVTTILTNLRTGPGTEYAVAAVVQKGIPVIIEGRNAAKGEREYLYQGISARPFRRQFSLADHALCLRGQRQRQDQELDRL